MSNRSRGLLLPVLAFLALVLGIKVFPVAAQEGAQVWIASPDIEEFPTITTYLDVHDAQGQFVYALEKNAVVVLEDTNRVPVDALRQLRPGVQLVVAVNPGPSFAIRNSQGVSRFEFLIQALQAWGQARLGSTIDDLSLLANEHPDTSHLSDPEDWMTALQAYQPDTRNAVPDLTVLARSIDVASDATPRAGMGKAVLFITTPMDVEAGVGLQSMASRAKQLGVHVYVWLVASTERFSSQSAKQLIELAEATGGKYFAYSGSETVPDVEAYLEPLRNTYFLAYDSRVSTNGTHEVAVEVALDGSEFTSPAVEFELEVLPPNVAFITPNLKIERQSREVEEGEAESLLPTRETFEILIEFPDGYQRSIERSALYVDGELVDENQSPPFDRFAWDLRQYTSDGDHTLKVEVTDSLGLSATSIDMIVSVTVRRDSRHVLRVLSQNQPFLAVLTVILAGALLALVLIRGGRLKPGFVLELRRRRRRSDPVTQPVRIKSEGESQRATGWLERLPWPQRRLDPQAMAFLIPISDSDDESSRPPISITKSEVTFGSKAGQGNQVIDDPSVEAIHAQLSQDDNGSFRLFDLGSVAGTWINYTPVSKGGAYLEHGDLIHFGRAGFRFTMRKPIRVRKPVIIPEERES